MSYLFSIKYNEVSVIFEQNELDLVNLTDFQHQYSSLQCHMILQKSFYADDLLLKKQLLLLLILKTVVLLNIFMETDVFL